MTKAINVRPRARGRVGGVWSALWVIKRKQRELIALAANLILLIYAFNCALCILHCALSNDDFRGFGALTADVEAGNEVVAVHRRALVVVKGKRDSIVVDIYQQCAHGLGAFGPDVLDFVLVVGPFAGCLAAFVVAGRCLHINGSGFAIGLAVGNNLFGVFPLCVAAPGVLARPFAATLVGVPVDAETTMEYLLSYRTKCLSRCR